MMSRVLKRRLNETTRFTGDRLRGNGSNDFPGPTKNAVTHSSATTPSFFARRFLLFLRNAMGAFGPKNAVVRVHYEDDILTSSPTLLVMALVGFFLGGGGGGC